MAYYRLSEKTFIGGALRDAGTVIEWNDTPSANMKKVDDVIGRAEAVPDAGVYVPRRPTGTEYVYGNEGAV